LLVALVFILTTFIKNDIEVDNGGKNKNDKPSKSTLAGVECANYDARPTAVMLSSDAEARPLSGIGEADMVFEMPVVENGFTRMMAVYQCNRPEELGSVRSSRLDFLPLALGLNAIYAHFGGEKEVLEELDSGIIDNIDGLKYDGKIYYRKKSIPRPHNAFTSSTLLGQAIFSLGYKKDGATISYPHEDPGQNLEVIEPPTIFNNGFAVNWKYDKKTNSYLRSRNGTPEIDKNNNEQVAAKNIAIMKTTWSPINKDYIRVKTVGSGEATVYKNGGIMSGTWKKADDKSKLYFYDYSGKEIKFAPGNIWVEIVVL
ncbi:MAG: DUF3048 domain-containing protein, partial [Candidatus Yanofskybacteria bacterium]|nr:DUF3048 domain-containing protein [Candidatus Yanofskybacteria bacterium]